MRKRKYLIGALLGVIGSVVLVGTASAVVTSQGVSSIISPAKAPKKAFVAVKSMKTSVDTNYSGSFTPNANQTVVNFSKDVKFTPGNIAQCNLGAIQSVPQSTSDSMCGASTVGRGVATVRSATGQTLTGVVAAYNGQKSGGKPTIGLHTDLFLPSGAYALSTTLTGILDTKTNQLTVAIPPTGTSITHFETTITKKKSGKNTFYVMARCGKKKKWATSETTAFTGGPTLSASSSQRCKQTK